MARSEEDTEEFFRQVQKDLADLMNLRTDETREWEKLQERIAQLEREEVIQEEDLPRFSQPRFEQAPTRESSSGSASQIQSQAANLVELVKKSRKHSNQHAATVKSQIDCLELRFKPLGLEQRSLTGLVKDLSQKQKGFGTALQRAQKQPKPKLNNIQEQQELRFADIERQQPEKFADIKKQQETIERQQSEKFANIKRQEVCEH